MTHQYLSKNQIKIHNHMLVIPQYVLFLSYANILNTFSNHVFNVSYLTLYHFLSTGKLSWPSTL